MAQFDVYLGELAGDPYWLDCQADTLSDFKTRFVVPLYSADHAAADRLHPLFDFDNEKVMMVTQLASAVPIQALGRRLGSLAEHRLKIISALDLLITGV